MERSNPSHRQGIFPLMLLPLEIRQKIYTYAVISVPLIELRVNYHGGAGNDTSVPGRARLYTMQDFRMLATNREFCKEMSDALYAKNAFEIALGQVERGQGICLHQIDLVRIRKCRFFLYAIGLHVIDLHAIESTRHPPDLDLWNSSYSTLRSGIIISGRSLLPLPSTSIRWKPCLSSVRSKTLSGSRSA